VTMAQLQDWAENVRDAAARIMADMAVRLGPRR